MDNKKTAIAVLSGLVVCALIAVLLLGLYAGGLMGKNKKGVVKGQEQNTQNVNPSEKNLPQLHDGMSFKEFRAWLALTEIKSMTIVSIDKDSEGNVTETTNAYYTERGMIAEKYSKNGAQEDVLRSYNLGLFDNGKYYEQTYDDNPSGGWETRVVDLENAKIRFAFGFAEFGKNRFELAYSLLGALIGIDYDSYDFLFSVKDGVVTWGTFASDTETVILKDFNKTTLPLRDDFKDYESFPVTDTFGKFEVRNVDGNETYALVDLDGLCEDKDEKPYIVEEYRVPEKHDGKEVTEIAFNSNKLTINDARKLIISKNVKKISGKDYNDLPVLVYEGDCVSWETVDVSEWERTADVIVKCKDGDIVVKKTA